MTKHESGICLLSWDDGSPDDLRIAEICSRHGLAATFFVPIKNREGRKTMQASQLRELASAGFEIGSHTREHVYLDSCDVAIGQSQILDGRRGLEAILGQCVDGFCYPGGRRPPGYAAFLRRNGFAYGRTTENFNQKNDGNRFEMPVTLQFYPHSRRVLIRNALRGKSVATKLGVAIPLCHETSLAGRLSFLIDRTVADRGLLHVWGHSWELESFGGWRLLEDFCRRLAGSNLQSMTVRCAADRTSKND